MVTVCAIDSIKMMSAVSTLACELNVPNKTAAPPINCRHHIVEDRVSSQTWPETEKGHSVWMNDAGVIEVC